jgi:CRP-like cAMP-binding protein
LTLEMATVGNEGFVGVPLLLGAQQETMDSVAQIGGEALSMSAEDFLNTIEDATTGLRKILLLSTQATFSQVIQNAACNRAHSIRQRCAKWILMTQDRVQAKSFILGRHFISYMLVVPEAIVTSTMEMLSKADLITYIGGRIHVLNRELLEEASCECYGVIKREYDRLLKTAR